jgi:phage baseplate assembly protein W
LLTQRLFDSPQLPAVHQEFRAGVEEAIGAWGAVGDGQ